MIPIVCTGCNERAEIPFIPADLTCVACKTGAHIDLDDEDLSSTAMLDDLPMLPLPSGTPEQDQDMDLLRDTDDKRKVLVPKGSAPYSQRALASKTAGVCSNCHGAGAVPAGGWEDPSEVDNGQVKCPTCYGHGTDAFEEDDRLSEGRDSGPNRDSTDDFHTYTGSLTKKADLGGIRNLLAQFNAKQVTVTYDDDLGLHTVAGTLTYHPPAVMVGKSATTDAHVLQVTVNGYGDFPDERTESTGSPSPLDYANIGGSAMASKTKVATKIDQIEAAVLQSNPGMSRSAARKVAVKTLARYPKVASGR